MKVFKNSIQGGWCGGCIIVAANSAEEAHDTAAKSFEVGYMYHDNEQNGNLKCDEFPKDNWKEVEDLNYEGTEPKVIVSEFYQE